MALKKKVEAVLKAKLFSDFVVSAVFPRKTAFSRQKLLQALHADSAGLSPSEVDRVISISALTPAETTTKRQIPRRNVVVPS